MALNVALTGAAGQICYSLASMIARGDMFGPDKPVILKLLEITPALPLLDGMELELQDCAFPLLEGIVKTDDPLVAFADADVALLVGAMPRKEGMERKDLLKANVKIFKEHGTAIDKVAKKSVKVLVVGNPANTNCFICSHYAPSIPKENFSALTRLDHNRSLAQIALKLTTSVSLVRNTIIWGNHSVTQYPDASHALVKCDGKEKSVSSAIPDDWLKHHFLTTVQKRGGVVLSARKASSAMSAAKAVTDHIRDWFSGTSEGTWVSMAVVSDGSYDVPEGLVFSFPVKINEGKWSIVKGLSVDEFSISHIKRNIKELTEERDAALAECS